MPRWMPNWMRRLPETWPGRFLTHILRRFFAHDVGRQGAALAYYLLFTLFPFLIFLSSLLGLLDLDISGIMGSLSPLLPASVLELIETYLTYVARTSSPAMLWFGLVFTIWFPMRAADCLMHAVRRAYHLPRPKNQIVYMAKVLLYTVFLLVSIALSLTLVTVGRAALEFAGRFFVVPEAFIELWTDLRFLVLGGVMFAAVGLLYAAAQDNLLLYAEHTWGHSSTITNPYDTMVLNLDMRKNSYASKAHEAASRMLNRIAAEQGDVLRYYGTSGRVRACGVNDRPGKRLVEFFIESHAFEAAEIRDEAGRVLPCQVSPHPRGRSIRFVDDFQPHEKKTYTYRAVETSREVNNTRRCYVGAERIRDIENDYDPVTCRLPYEAETACFRLRYRVREGVLSLSDKRTGRELLGRGYRLVEFDGPADAYIVNTCTVTGVSDKKCRNIIRRARKRAPEGVVAVCGCYAQTDPEAVGRLGADLVSGSAGRLAFLDRLEELLKAEYQELFQNLIGSTQDLTLSVEQVQEILDSLPDDLSEERRQVILTAYQLLGKVNYFWGGKSLVLGWDSRWGIPREVTAAGSPSSGTIRPYGLDCSGFVDWVFYNVSNGGYVIGHGGGARMQHTYCRNISWNQAIPGDLVFYPEDTHVGIVCGFDENGNVLIIHCASGANNVVVTGRSGFTSIARPNYYSE